MTTLERRTKLIKNREITMKGVFLLSSIFSIFALVAICIFLFARGFPTIFKEIGFFDFIFGRTWHPQIEIFGIWPMILGSIYVTALTTLIGVTLGIFTAVFLFKFCPKKLVGVIRKVVNLMAGVPSILFGLFGIMVVVPFLASISHTAMGEGILAASIILSIMILPTVVSISLNALYAVPDTIYEGALALGATKEQAVFKTVLPAAKSGVLTAVVLSIGRAIGETMAVIMVVGQSSRIPTDILQPINTMTATIASGALEVDGLHFEALIAIGVVLFIFTLVLNAGFSFFKTKGTRKNKKKEQEKEVELQATDVGKRKFSFFGLKFGFSKTSNKIKTVISYVCTFCALAAIFGIIFFILQRGLPYLSFNFIFGEYSLDSPTLINSIAGTFYLIFIGIAIAAPIGIATAIFLSEYASKSKLIRYIRIAIETLAGIPSIVYGLFGYVLFVVTFGWGYSLLGGGITLSIMILPMVIRTTEESLLSVPDMHREGSFALGASKVRTTFRIVLPQAAGGIVSSLILAIGRIVSESAVLLLTIGMLVNTMPDSAMSPGTSLALDVYYLGSHGFPKHAAATGAFLLIFVMGLNLLATLIGKLLTKGKGKK